MAHVDVVVVSYNSRQHLRGCLEPLARLADVYVVVVDNASTDGSVNTLDGLPVTILARSQNGGFAVGCNAGWRAGSAPHVLFLNPDATIDESSLRRLIAVLEELPTAGAVAPRIEHPDGSVAHSLRRFPRPTSTLAQALFLHRLFPRAAWADELVRDPAAYAHAWSPDWVSGACLLVRRAALERLEGWDEGFFLYGEDVDLCARLREAGFGLRFEPGARAVHEEGASTPRAATYPLLAAARLRYARKHFSRPARAVDRVAVALGALTHLVVGKSGLTARRGHARALLIALTGRESLRPADTVPALAQDASSD